MNAPPAAYSKPRPVSIDSGNYSIALYTELESIRDDWLELFAGLHNPTLFQHIAWHEAFVYGHYMPATFGQLLFAVVTQDKRTVALIPLAYRRDKYYGIPARIVELLFPTDMGVRDFPLADDANGGEILHAVLDHALPGAGYIWDITTLPDLTINSAAFAAFSRMPTRRKLAIAHHYSNRLKCASERSQCFAHVSKSYVKNAKPKRKQLATLGKVEYELITDPAALPQVLELFIDLENAGWKGSEKTSLHHDLKQKAFYESLFTNPLPALNGCVAVMRLDGRPIAAYLCTRTGDTLWLLKITYADDLKKYAPGSLTLLYLLEHCAEDDSISYISFITAPTWTELWHPERIVVVEGETFATTATGLLLGTVMHAINLARQLKRRKIMRPAFTFWMRIWNAARGLIRN